MLKDTGIEINLMDKENLVEEWLNKDHQMTY
jgi:hypothetical protein